MGRGPFAMRVDHIKIGSSSSAAREGATTCAAVGRRIRASSKYSAHRFATAASQMRIAACADADGRSTFVDQLQWHLLAPDDLAYSLCEHEFDLPPLTFCRAAWQSKDGFFPARQLRPGRQTGRGKKLSFRAISFWERSRFWRRAWPPPPANGDRFA